MVGFGWGWICGGEGLVVLVGGVVKEMGERGGDGGLMGGG